MTVIEHYVRCPRSICDKGKVFDTVNGIRQGPGYRCSVCNGVGFVPSTACQEAVDTSGQVHVDALSEALGDISNDIDGYVPVAEIIAAVLAARDAGQ